MNVWSLWTRVPILHLLTVIESRSPYPQLTTPTTAYRPPSRTTATRGPPGSPWHESLPTPLQCNIHIIFVSAGFWMQWRRLYPLTDDMLRTDTRTMAPYVWASVVTVAGWFPPGLPGAPLDIGHTLELPRIISQLLQSSHDAMMSICPRSLG